ncbi:hypothetical protein D6V10_07640 [Vibrio cholerae]|nr:hypothetical protein [Vibrio cholerae]
MFTDTFSLFFRIVEGQQIDETLHMAALQFIQWVNGLSIDQRFVFSILSMLLLTAGFELSMRLIRLFLNSIRWGAES